ASRSVTENRRIHDGQHTMTPQHKPGFSLAIFFVDFLYNTLNTTVNVITDYDQQQNNKRKNQYLPYARRPSSAGQIAVPVRYNQYQRRPYPSNDQCITACCNSCYD